MNNQLKIGTLLGLTVLALISLFFVDPIPQDIQYHQFSDQVSFWGVPNNLNVLSNIPFVVVGIIALIHLRRIDSKTVFGVFRTVPIIFFIGLILTGLGSGYYHLAPTNETLVWDRLPMTIAFMAFFSFVLAIHIQKGIGQFLLWPFIILGASSVFYWDYTESLGAGDLRFYAVIQFLPIILIPMIIWMFPSRTYKAIYIWGVIAIYVAAKLAEHFDYQIYELLGVSGHSLKHVIAAFSGILFLSAIQSIKSR